MGLNEKLIWTESMKTAAALADYSSKQYYGAKMSRPNHCPSDQ